MRRLLMGLCLLAGCATPAAPDPYAYTPPDKTPYDARPPLKEQYLKAHRAAWDNQVSKVSLERLEQALRGEGVSLAGIHETCCEATPNVTRGWYRGQEDGQRFLERIAGNTDRVDEVLVRVRRLKSEIEARPVADWYIADGYSPDDLVEVEEQGGAVVRVYRDATRTRLHEVRQMKDGLRHGRCEEYDVNGSLRAVSSWAGGLQEGERVHYLDSGEISGRSRYHLGKLQGRELHYGDDGLLNSYREYDAGFLHGRQVEWHPDGRLLQAWRWKAGFKDGRCVTYLESGARVEVYASGEKVGDSVEVPDPDLLPEDERPATLSRLRGQYPR